MEKVRAREMENQRQVSGYILSKWQFQALYIDRWKFYSQFPFSYRLHLVSVNRHLRIRVSKVYRDRLGRNSACGGGNSSLGYISMPVFNAPDMYIQAHSQMSSLDCDADQRRAKITFPKLLRTRKRNFVMREFQLASIRIVILINKKYSFAFIVC